MCINPHCAGLSDCATCEARANASEREADQQMRHDEKCRKIIMGMLQDDLRTSQHRADWLWMARGSQDVSADLARISDRCVAIRWAISFLSDTTTGDT